MKKRLLIPPALRRQRVTGGRWGSPVGNRNALKHGDFTRQRLAFYAEIRAHVRRCQELVEALKPDAKDGHPNSALPS